jgi:hypothetical protein
MTVHHNTGNTYAVKLNTDELKQLAYKSYCEHLAAGKSKRGWLFKHPHVKHGLTWETMEKYIRENEDIFDPSQKKAAEAEGFNYWESIVHESAKGDAPKANTATLQMLMRNKYGWDKKEDRKEDSPIEITQAYEKVMLQISAHQRSREIECESEETN